MSIQLGSQRQRCRSDSGPARAPFAGDAGILDGMGRQLRRELRTKGRVCRRAYEEAFGRPYRPRHRIVPYARVLAVAAAATSMTFVLKLLGLVLLIPLPTSVVVSVLPALVH